MARLDLLHSINAALRSAMRQDDRVLVIGEDVGRCGGVFRATAGLQQEFGASRVIDTPHSETGIVGTAIGMALGGMRPVPEIQFADSSYPAFDQIVNELAKYRYRSGGRYTCPVVVRMPVGGGVRGGHYHSQSPEAHFCHVAGLKVVMPSSPHDAKGLLLSALRGADPVIFMEPKRLYQAAKAEVPDVDYTVPLGAARVVREGRHASVLTYGAMVPVCLDAADELAAAGIEAEVIDLRTLVPLDLALILDSLARTGRAVVVHEAPRTGGYGAEIAALLGEHALLHLEAPVMRVTGYDTPFPYTLEHEYLPDSGRVAEAVRQVVEY